MRAFTEKCNIHLYNLPRRETGSGYIVTLFWLPIYPSDDSLQVSLAHAKISASFFILTPHCHAVRSKFMESHGTMRCWSLLFLSMWISTEI